MGEVSLLKYSFVNKAKVTHTSQPEVENYEKNSKNMAMM